MHSIRIISVAMLAILPNSVFTTVVRYADELKILDENKAEYEKFKAAAIPIMPEEYMKKEIILVKYFKYNGMSADKGIQAIKNNVAFREEIGYHKVPEADVAEFDVSYPHSFLTDKFGRIVLTLWGKDFDMAKASGDPAFQKRWTAWIFSKFERMYEMATASKNVVGVGFLMDHKDMDASKSICVSCLGLTKYVFGEVERRFPLGLQFGIVVNADPLIHVSLNIVKNVLSPFLQSDMLINDDDDTKWIPVLSNYIAEVNIPRGVHVKSKSGKPSASVGYKLLK